MNRTRNSLEMNKAIEKGSWPRFTSGFWRCSLSMNLPFGVPRLRGPGRLKAGLQTRCRVGSWPQLTSNFWRCSLPMNLPEAIRNFVAGEAKFRRARFMGRMRGYIPWRLSLR